MEPEKVSVKVSEKVSEKTQKMTLSDLGMFMPLGISSPDGMVKSFGVKPWRFKEEKQLAELMGKKKSSNLAEYVSIVLSTMCTHIGQHNFEEMRWEEKLLLISQMWMGDVFYIYIMLRKEAIGRELNLRPTCPSCGESFDFTGDLDSIEVKTASALKNAQWEYKLKTPFNIRGKKAEKFIMGPPRWNNIEMLKDNDPDLNVAAKITLIRGCIHSIEGLGEQHVLVEEELDELSKFDMETISNDIDENSIGPSMFLETKCPRNACPGRRSEKLFRQEIDWRYKSFFGISSR